MVVAAVSMAVSSAPAQDTLSEEGFEFFYDSLSPYGDWIRVGNYGPCWRPETGENWAPYTEGYWAYTDVGWTWVSHEPFGSIVYHYGRWLLTDRGWCWVPGADWSPAWVSWRTGQDYVGWAPLPPEVPWHPQRGISTWVDVHTEIGPAYYRFCAVRDFTSPVLSGVLLRPSRNSVIMVRTENVTQITVRNSSVFCGGPRYDWVSEHCAGRVPLLRVAREENVSRFRSLQPLGGGVQNIVHNNILVLPAPRRVEFNVSVQNFPAQSVNVSVSKGWYSNRSENERIKSHINREWEERRTPPTAASTVRDPNGAAVRLNAPTAAEKAAVLGEIGANPGAVPTTGGGGGLLRPGKGVQGSSLQGDSRTLEIPKAQPVQPSSLPPSQAALQNPAVPVGVQTLPAVGTKLPQQPGGQTQSQPSANLGAPKSEAAQALRNPSSPAGFEPRELHPEPGLDKQPGGLTPKQVATQSASRNVEGGTDRSTGTQALQPPGSSELRQIQRPAAVQQPERNPFTATPSLPPSITGQSARNALPGSELDSPSRNQPWQGNLKSPGSGSVSQGFSAPTRSVQGPPPGFPQPSVSRTGPGLQSPQASQIQTPLQSRQMPVGTGFLQGREAAGQLPSSPGGASRVVGGASPVRSTQPARIGQSAPSFEQPTRVQSPGLPQTPRPPQSSFGAPSNPAGAGSSSGARPSGPPPGSGMAPPSLPSPSQTQAPGATGQKKKPGEPGYVPGAP
jgi:hypothetical protein